MRFMGETMTCAMCGKQQKSDPAIESDWRYIEVDDKAGYICPAHFPLDPATATKEDWSKCYQAAILAVMRGTSAET
jgi:hypothetical protein